MLQQQPAAAGFVSRRLVSHERLPLSCTIDAHTPRSLPFVTPYELMRACAWVLWLDICFACFACCVVLCLLVQVRAIHFPKDAVLDSQQ